MIIAPNMFAHEMPGSGAVPDAVPGAARDRAGRSGAGQPMLRTERLLLRAPRLEDFALYSALLSGARGAVFGGPLTRAEARDGWMRMVGQRLMRGHGVWTLETRASDIDRDLPVGQIAGFALIKAERAGSAPEPGWVLAADFEGRGLAREATRALSDYTRDSVNFTALVNAVDPAHGRARGLAPQLGARFDALHDDSEIWRHLPPRGTRGAR